MTTHAKLGQFDAFGTSGASDPFGADAPGANEDIEILGPHLRVSGTVNLGRFPRLSDLVNRSPGYLHLREARLLQRNGDPTNLTMRELLVNRDEITFVGQRTGAARSVLEQQSGRPRDFGASPVPKLYRRFVVFTPGHIITGDVYVFDESTLASFVESADPRFAPMVNVAARSLADRRVISHFELLLVNKTQMTAAAEADLAADVAD